MSTEEQQQRLDAEWEWIQRVVELNDTDHGRGYGCYHGRTDEDLQETLDYMKQVLCAAGEGFLKGLVVCCIAGIMYHCIG